MPVAGDVSSHPGHQETSTRTPRFPDIAFKAKDERSKPALDPETSVFGSCKPQHSHILNCSPNCGAHSRAPKISERAGDSVSSCKYGVSGSLKSAMGQLQVLSPYSTSLRPHLLQSRRVDRSPQSPTGPDSG